MAEGDGLAGCVERGEDPSEEGLPGGAAGGDVAALRGAREGEDNFCFWVMGHDGKRESAGQAGEGLACHPARNVFGVMWGKAKWHGERLLLVPSGAGYVIFFKRGFPRGRVAIPQGIRKG